MASSRLNGTNKKKYVFITPHTHWDREWYLPFQKFRYMLVELVDKLLAIMKEDQEYVFTFDGQTIVLEDYLEIRPEKRDELLGLIREKRIIVGPWYILPDIWLVGQETLIRNLEYSYDIAKDFKIPLMDIGYFPDSFGFSQAIPQLLGDLTNLRAAMLWRGIPEEVSTVPFLWRGKNSSETSILTIYLPFGYGNAASLPSVIEQLQPFSPLPIYLLQNGTDHKFPDHQMAKNLKEVNFNDMELNLAVLPDFVDKLQELIGEENYQPPEYVGELRSTHRANLLSNTYSARIWIKQWNEKVEDLLIHYAEPISTYSWFYLGKNYPTSYMSQAWKWFLRNQPHDSICGCSSDETHEETKFRYSYAQTIAESLIESNLKEFGKTSPQEEVSTVLAYNPTNSSNLPMLVEIETQGENQFHSILSKGSSYDIQTFEESRGEVFNMTVGTFKFRTMMKMFPGRKIIDFYINKYELFDDGADTFEIRLLVGDSPVGSLDTDELKSSVEEAAESGKYKRFHLIVSKDIIRTLYAMVPLQAWGFTKLELSSSQKEIQDISLIVTQNSVSNRFYELKFNKDGSFDLNDKQTETSYKRLHTFEDWGDRGDEYTFGRLEPEYVKITNVKREVKISGPIFSDIQQVGYLEIYKEMDSSRKKRVGKETIKVSSNFRFYRDIGRIDVTTKLRNTAKDHRLRISFNLPFKTEYTITSTHFGNIKRLGEAVINESDLEVATGIQPQKKYIRVEDPMGPSALTLLNYGLPEIELVDGKVLALTLIRSVGWLSQSEIPERPEIAGPILATPGAQELHSSYSFQYGIMCHSKDEPITSSIDHSEVSFLEPRGVFTTETGIKEQIEPLIEISDPKIRISSLRTRNNSILVTLFNISDNTVTTKIELADKITKLTPIKIDGSIKGESISVDKIGEIEFNPNEIRMFTLD
ncbi:MAG: glycoside hydrolase family 38 N-terminal domain-containing protein [Candidatus Hodarchaeales archaeon]|jgi:alpha-mannosidase